MAKQLVFQLEDGGSIPTSPLQYIVKECRFKDIRYLLEMYHYKGGHMGGGISFCLSLSSVFDIVGGAVIGLPRHSAHYPDSMDIRRLVLSPVCPKNTASYFLSKIIWHIKNNTKVSTVLSYADLSVGHIGIIYKAANFRLVGYTSCTKHIFWNGVRYHPRSLTIERPYSHKLREAVKQGSARIETGKPKAIYVYKINRE